MSKCGQPCEIYSRVSGYFRPVKNWNHGKKEEFKERKTYDTTKGSPMNEKQNAKLIAILAMVVLAGLVLNGCSSPTMTETVNPLLDSGGKVILLPDGKVATQIIRVKKESNWPLRGKIADMHQNAFFLKVETTGSAQTGSAMPNVDLAVGDNHASDLPAIDFSDVTANITVPDAKSYANSSEYLHVQKSAWPWVSEFSIIDYDYKSAGVGAPKPTVKLNINAESGTSNTAAAGTPTPQRLSSASIMGVSPEVAAAVDEATNAAATSTGKPTTLAFGTNGTMADIAQQAQDWLAKPENQAQAKSWFSQAWTWISGLF